MTLEEQQKEVIALSVAIAKELNKATTPVIALASLVSSMISTILAGEKVMNQRFFYQVMTDITKKYEEMKKEV